MNARELSVSAEYLVRPEYGADWREELEEFATREGIDAAWFSGLGSLQDAEVWHYDQADREFRSVRFDEPVEMAACVGSVSLLDGERFVHAHAVLARPSGQTLAGHLDAGTVFAGECYLRAFEEPLDRTYDDDTGLDLLL